jgi:hypothetical protein
MRRRNIDRGPAERRVRTNEFKVRKAPAAPTLMADLRKQLNQCTRERDQALEREIATSEVLRLIFNVARQSRNWYFDQS